MPTYHMRRRDREIVSRQELQSILRRGRYMTLAMCRTGEPYVVTLSYGLSEQENALYFHCTHEGQKLEFLRANSTVCATVVEDLGYKEGECSHSYRSVVVRGRMQVIEDQEGKAHGLRVLLAHQEKDPQGVARRLLPADASYAGVTVLRLEITDITGKQSL